MIVERIYFGRPCAMAVARIIASVYFRARQGHYSSSILAEHYRGERMVIRNPQWVEPRVLH